MKFILVIILIWLCVNSYSQTNVSGGIFSNTTWTLANSPYIVTGDVALYPGFSLDVEPGTIIKFEEGKRLIVRGSLNLNGAENQHITITSSNVNPTYGSWKGIEIENDQGGEVYGTYVHAEYADYFIKILSSSSGEVLRIINSKISNCNYAFYGYDGDSNFTVVLENDSIINNKYGFIYSQNLNVNNCLFSNGQKGIHGWSGPEINIVDSEFSHFTVWPFKLAGTIENCHIHDNAVGISMKPDLEVFDCFIENNQIGVSADYSTQVSGELIHDNTICNNSEYNFKHLYSYSINIPNNCWCSDDNDEIAETIYDAYDDVALGIVSFTPVNADCIISAKEDVTISNKGFYPNPAMKYIFVEDYCESEYELYSVKGELLQKGSCASKIDISFLNKGIYILKFYNDGECKMEKLIKQ